MNESNVDVASRVLAFVDLTKYEPAQDFGGQEWYRQLKKRFDLLPPWRPSMHDGDFVSITEVLTHPLAGRAVYADFFCHPGRHELIADMNLMDLWRERRKVLKYAPELINKLDDHCESPEYLQQNHYSVPEAYLQPLSSLSMQYSEAFSSEEYQPMELRPSIAIDLKATDEKLKLAFEEWLAIKRKEQHQLNLPLQRQKPFQASDFDRWYKLRVLPYLDMTIALIYTGQTATQRTLGDRLFFDEDVDTTEKVRKTLRPLVREIMNQFTPYNFET